MENFFVMLMWFPVGDVILQSSEAITTKYETREACESQFVKMLNDSDGLWVPSIKKSISTGNATYMLKNENGDIKVLYLCEEVKF